MYANNTNKGGASNWPVVMMVKCMMLQRWINLSDPMLEEMLLDRLSFRRFIGLRMENKTPDETTFVIFRKRLCKHGHSATPFDKIVEILKQRGVILEEGTCVDATIIEAPRGVNAVTEPVQRTEPQATLRNTVQSITALGSHSNRS